MSYKIKAEVERVFDEDQKTDTFKTRDLILKTDGQYPQMVKIQFHNERSDLLDKVKKDDFVEVHFDVRGREWNDKYFTNLVGWKIDVVQSSEPSNEPIMTDKTKVVNSKSPAPEKASKKTEAPESEGGLYDPEDPPF